MKAKSDCDSLPPSKLDLKRDRLMYLYEKKAQQERKRMVEKSKVTTTQPDDVASKAKRLLKGQTATPKGRDWVAAQYEKNKLNNLHSNIQLCSESIISSARSALPDSPVARSASPSNSQNSSHHSRQR